MDIRKRNNVNRSGQGEEILVFGNGFGCDQGLWRHITAALQKDFQTVTFDYSGKGERYKDLNGYVSDLVEVVDSLKAPSVSYIGHSVSGMLGMLAARQKPKLFRQLILVGASPCYIDSPGYKGGFSREAIDGIIKSIEANFAEWAKTMAPVLMGNPDRPALATELTQFYLKNDPKIAATYARNIFLSDYRQQLSQCKTPAVILQMAEDAVVPVEVGHYLHKQLRNSELVLLKARGHYPSLSAPEELISVIKSYAAVEKKRKAS